MPFSNGALVGAPGNVNIIGNYKQPELVANPPVQHLLPVRRHRQQSGGLYDGQYPAGQHGNLQHCDWRAIRRRRSLPSSQRLQYTSQTNSTVLNIRQQLHPMVDMSLFKQFIIREGTSFEIRGEFFNVFNTPEWGGPSRAWCSNAGSSSSGYSADQSNGIFAQANDRAYRSTDGAYQLLSAHLASPRAGACAGPALPVRHGGICRVTVIPARRGALTKRLVKEWGTWRARAKTDETEAAPDPEAFRKMIASGKSIPSKAAPSERLAVGLLSAARTLIRRLMLIRLLVGLSSAIGLAQATAPEAHCERFASPPPEAGCAATGGG